jgi:hypothetical protein
MVLPLKSDCQLGSAACTAGELKLIAAAMVSKNAGFFKRLVMLLFYMRIFPCRSKITSCAGKNLWHSCEIK